MAKTTITLASSNGDSVVCTAPGDGWILDDIILDQDPKGLYDISFEVRTQSGAFENGGRATGIDVPICRAVMPFWLTPESRKRFQKLWGSPGFFRKVKMTWDGPSGPRFLILRLAKNIEYTTEEGYDADIEKVYKAVVVALGLNPMYEGPENAAQWTNPDDRFNIIIVATGGTFTVTVLNTGTNATATTGDLAYNISNADLQTAIQGLPNVGAGNATVSGPAGNRLVVFTAAVPAKLSANGANLTGNPHSIKTQYAPNTGYFNVWNPTDQPEWLMWDADSAEEWQVPDFSFGQELRFNRPTGADAARMIVLAAITPTQAPLSIWADPLQDTYLAADLSNYAGLMNGVEPRYAVPPYTGTVSVPVVVPIICRGPKGAKLTLRQRRFWSAESGLE